MSNPVVATTLDKVKAIIVDKLGVEDGQVSIDTTFEELGADSLDLVELVMAFEEAFGIEISDEDAEGIKTVANAVSYIDRVVT